EVGRQYPLDLQSRLVEQPHVVHTAAPDPAFPQTVLDRPRRERGIPLLAREALLLRRRHDLAITHQARGAVMIERRDPENVQGGRSAGGAALSCWLSDGAQPSQFADRKWPDRVPASARLRPRGRVTAFSRQTALSAGPAAPLP